MFAFTRFYSTIENAAIVDSDGGNFWTGSVVIDGNAAPIRGSHPAHLKAALRARCPAAHLVLMAKPEPTPPLCLLIAAACLNRGKTISQMIRASGYTYGYVNQLWAGTRPIAEISDHFAWVVGQLANLPSLVVLFIAGRIDRSVFEELGEPGEAVARHVAAAAEAALKEARLTVSEAECRVISEERRVRAQRKMPPGVAVALYDEMEKLQESSEDEHDQKLVRGALRKLVGRGSQGQPVSTP